MAIFADYAADFLEYGLSVIPVSGKRPVIKNWSIFCKDFADGDDLHEWINKYPNLNIGLCLGKASKIIAIDIDTDDKKIMSIINDILPQSPIVKRGAKGETRFYLYSGQKSRTIKIGGMQVIDVLSDGRQTVMPPSIHPNNNKPYVYTSELHLPEAVDELADLKDEIIYSLDLALNALNTGITVDDEPSGRNDFLKKYACAMLEKMSSEDLAEKLVQKDKELYGKSPLFSDPSEYPQTYGEPLLSAYEFTTNIKKAILKKKIDRKEPLGEIGQNKTPGLKTHYPHFKKFFDDVIGGARRDKISGQVKIKIGDIWQPLINEIRHLRSMAHERGLSRGYVEDHLCVWMSGLPEELLIDIPEWDGFDYIEELSHFVELENLERSHFVELIKEWGAGVFKRIENPLYQNKLIILKGDQGLGKDTLIYEMLGGFGYYFNNLMLTHNEKDNFLGAQRNIINNISEFDRTSRVSVSTLKHLITTPSENIRAPYERAETQLIFRCSFIATCNVDDILRDTTGNRRYVIFDLKNIDWRYPKNRQMQYIAQFKAMAASGYVAGDQAKSTMDVYIEHNTPYSLEEEVVSEWDNILTKKYTQLPPVQRPASDHKFRRHEVIDELSQISKNFGIKMQRLAHILKLYDRGGRDTQSVFYLYKNVNSEHYGLEKSNVLSLTRSDGKPT